MILLPIIKIIQNNDNFYNQHNLIAYLRKRQDNEITIELIKYSMFNYDSSNYDIYCCRY